MALTVLVVDDYADARLLLSYMLEDAGFHVIHAENAEAALPLVRQHRPAAIVMDLHLPGMNGVEATRHLRADPDLARIPVVAHTLSSRPLNDEERALFDAVFGKPSPPESFVEVLQRAIRDREERD